MYKIVHKQKIVALVDEPRYVKHNLKGTLVQCGRIEAEGIACCGEVYDISNSYAEPENSGEYIIGIANKADEATSINNIVFSTLAENETIDEVTASEHAECFEEWVANYDYRQGNIRRYGNKLYKCLQSHRSQDDWTPDVTASLWKVIGDPAEEFPEWSRPIGAGDEYMTGDKVTFEGQHYISLIDYNVWSPIEYPSGWEMVA